GVNGMKPVLGPVTPATPAAFAGFEAGETIVKIGTEPVSTWQDARWILLEQVVDKSPVVTVETLNQRGEIGWRNLDLSDFQADDLDGDFLKKIGLNIYQPAIRPIIAQVTPEGAGSRAGLLADDEILSVNDEQITSWEDLVGQIRGNPGQPLMLEIHRGNSVLDIQVTPDTVTEKNEKIGKIGIAPKIDPSEFEGLLVKTSYPLGVSMIKAMERTWETSIFTLRMLGKMVAGEVSWKNVSGPITIADYAGQSAQMGLAPYLGFLALISISLGVLNLLPIPILDGGHLLYYAIEIVKGSPLSDHAMEMGQRIGMALLFALMACAIYNDISRLVSS
ncbi:MAG: RIP metalloprotease RseP, partial [Nitrosospira sp.]|nr:RIP metalloprotease RseP [Nitrosospira sp.]